MPWIGHFWTSRRLHPVHSLHPYPAKFVPALPRRIIEALSDLGDLIMDPFAGSGTTLVEALNSRPSGDRR